MHFNNRDWLAAGGLFTAFILLTWASTALLGDSGAYCTLGALISFSLLVTLSVFRYLREEIRYLEDGLGGAPRPPKNVPRQLRQRFTLGEKIPVVSLYRDDAYSPELPLTYRLEDFEHYQREIREARFNYYGQTGEWLQQALRNHDLKGKRVAIFGSTSPRCESLCLSFGAKITTIEYNRILSEHPDVVVITPHEYDQNPVLFDAAISISTFEHDGLGRYGDSINPDGDLQAMRKTLGMVMDGGLLFLAVPMGKDKLVWNAHRIYGRIRLPLLIEGWEQVDSYGFEDSSLDRDTGTSASYHPVLVLRKPNTNLNTADNGQMGGVQKL